MYSCQHIFGNSMVNKSCCFWLICKVIRDLCIVYSSSSTYVQCGMHIHSEAYTNNVKCIYSSVTGHTIQCSWFICGKYSDKVVTYLHMNTLTYVAYMWHFRGLFIFGTYMTITCFLSHDADSDINGILCICHIEMIV